MIDVVVLSCINAEQSQPGRVLLVLANVATARVAIIGLKLNIIRIQLMVIATSHRRFLPE